MKIALGSDHAGFFLKEYLRDRLKSEGFDVVDLGTHYPDPADYPIYAQKVARTVLAGEADFGVLICKTGLGMSIAANRFKGIRAGLCLTPEYAEMARRHNNANIICFGAGYIDKNEAYDILMKFLTTPFDGDKPAGARHKRRVELIDKTD